MKNLEKLRNMKVENDKELLPEEREFYFNTSEKNKNKAYCTAKSKPYIKWLLKCDDLKPTRYYTDEQNNLVHLEGELPITYVSFRTSPKSQNYLSRALA